MEVDWLKTTTSSQQENLRTLFDVWQSLVIRESARGKERVQRGKEKGRGLKALVQADPEHDIVCRCQNPHGHVHHLLVIGIFLS